MRQRIHFRCCALILGLMCVSPHLVAQEQTLHERLKQIIAASSLMQEEMAPWHLRMTFQLYSLGGKKAETGTIEEWWSSSRDHKIVIDSPSYHRGETSSDVQVKDPRASYLVDLLFQQVVDPVPRYYGNPDTVELYDDTQKLGGANLSCLTFGRTGEDMCANASANTEIYTEPGKPIIRISRDSSTMVFVRNTIGKFRNVQLGIDDTITFNDKPAITGHIETLEAYQPPAEVASTPPVAAGPVAEIKVPANVLAGSLIHKEAPEYPFEMRQRRISGTVVLRVLITKDGTIGSLTVLASPDPSFSTAALDAVKRWKYKPYLYFGEPTDVDTTITINFNIGH